MIALNVKITSKSVRLQPVLLKKRFEVNKKQIFSCEKWEIQIVVFMIMLTRSSMRYAGNVSRGYHKTIKWIHGLCTWDSYRLECVGVNLHI